MVGLARAVARRQKALTRKVVNCILNNGDGVEAQGVDWIFERI
jgi:hypothetical protein